MRLPWNVWRKSSIDRFTTKVFKNNRYRNNISSKLKKCHESDCDGSRHLSYVLSPSRDTGDHGQCFSVCEDFLSRTSGFWVECSARRGSVVFVACRWRVSWVPLICRIHVRLLIRIASYTHRGPVIPELLKNQPLSSQILSLHVAGHAQNCSDRHALVWGVGPSIVEVLLCAKPLLHTW